MVTSALSPDVAYLAELDVVPFDLEEITGPVPVAQASTTEWESLDDLQVWYDMGFIGVVEQGRAFPSGWESATTGQIIAYCMGQADSAGGSPRQTMPV